MGKTAIEVNDYPGFISNRVLMPLGVRFQKELALAPGMIDATAVDEVLLVCRKHGAAQADAAAPLTPLL